jgi:hypothetical protein
MKWYINKVVIFIEIVYICFPNSLSSHRQKAGRATQLSKIRDYFLAPNALTARITTSNPRARSSLCRDRLSSRRHPLKLQPDTFSNHATLFLFFPLLPQPKEPPRAHHFVVTASGILRRVRELAVFEPETTAICGSCRSALGCGSGWAVTRDVFKEGFNIGVGEASGVAQPSVASVWCAFRRGCVGGVLRRVVLTWFLGLTRSASCSGGQSANDRDFVGFAWWRLAPRAV